MYQHLSDFIAALAKHFDIGSREAARDDVPF
jgi:hypothetical protein